MEENQIQISSTEQTAMPPKKKKLSARSIIALVFSCLFLAMVSVFPIMKLCGVKPGVNYENRPLTERPTAQDWINDYSNASNKFESYYNDNFPLKSTMLELYSLFEYNIFKSSLLPNMVSIGNDGWLFLEGDGANDVRKIIGGELYSLEMLESIYQGIMAKYNQLKAIGKEYIVYLAPEKQMIYPELDRLKIAEYTVIDQVIDYLKEKNCPVPIINGADDLLVKKSLGDQLYYKFDSHWNSLGAHYGYEKALSVVKQLFPNANIPYAKNYQIGKGECSGDLAGMIYLSKHLKEQTFIFDYEYKPTYESIDNYVKVSSAVQSDLKILIYGDSFVQMNYWGPCFSQSATETRIMHRRSGFGAVLQNVGESNVVIEECVQRSLSSLFLH